MHKENPNLFFRNPKRRRHSTTAISRHTLPCTVLSSPSELVSSSSTPRRHRRRPAARRTPPSFSPQVSAGSFPRQPSLVDLSRVSKPFTWSPAASSRWGVATDEQLAAVVVERQPEAVSPQNRNPTRVSSLQTEPAPEPTSEPAPAARVP